jgi:hypothetical protein
MHLIEIIQVTLLLVVGALGFGLLLWVRFVHARALPPAWFERQTLRPAARPAPEAPRALDRYRYPQAEPSP